MTTITIDRAVVEQALEALLKSHTCPLLPDDCEAAIAALRTALAQQAEPVCTDCRGIGYDASGQLCGCQDKPSPCAYPNCVGGQAGTICKPSCPGGTK